jgi:hypothetical protein
VVFTFFSVVGFILWIFPHVLLGVGWSQSSTRG